MHIPSFRRPSTQGRRSFLGVAALAGLSFLRPRALTAAGEPAESEPSSGGAPSEWDFSWADQLQGTHKQVFDVGKLEDAPLLTVSNYLRAIKEVYGLEYPRVNAVVGIAFTNFPLNASDALFEKFPIGELWQLKDAATSSWAKRNPFMEAPPPPPAMANDAARQRDMGEMMRMATLTSLRQRGVIFWQCNNALNGVAARLAGATQRPYTDVQRELRAGLLPGVKLVPAHTMAIGLLQQKGCTYERL